MIGTDYIFGRKNAAGIIIPPGLFSNYKFNELVATDPVLDSYGNNHGVNTNCAAQQAGKLGTSYGYNGSTSNVIIPYSSDFNFTNATNDLPFSISTWLYINPGTATFFGIGKTNGSARVWEIIYEGGNLRFRLCSGTTTTRRERFGTMTLGNWNNVIVTYDGSGSSTGMNLYVNLEEKTGTNNAGTYTKMPLNTNDVWIGKYPTLTSYTIPGRVDETEFYKDHVLSEAERAAIWNNGNGRSLNF